MRSASFSCRCDLRPPNERRALLRSAKTVDVFLGPIPGESWARDMVRRNGLTLAGQPARLSSADRAGWTYRDPGRVSETLSAGSSGRRHRAKAQVRPYTGYRPLSVISEKLPIVAAAIAREMAPPSFAPPPSGLAHPYRQSESNTFR
jgi:hypothetical protein